MQKGKGFLALVRNGWLAIVLVACLLVGVVCLADGAGKEAQSSRLEVESMGAIEAQAWQLAAKVVGTREGVQQQFVTELLDLYYEARDSDVVVLCSPGGWGKERLSADRQGGSWLAGIEAKLTEMGCEYCVVEDVRTGAGLMEYLFEFKEQLMHYPSKAKQLAAKIQFLTEQITGLEVLVTGQSNGAAFAGEVASRLADNPGVYSIEVGVPFWHRVPQLERSLVIGGSGVGVDALAKRDIVALLKANWLKLFVIGQAPAFTPVDWLITRAFLVFGSYDFNLGLEAPGHKYMWEYSGVGPVIETFLAKNFDGK